MRIVVDASVALKWYVPEIHSEAATRVLDARRSGVRLHVPDLFYPEFGNILSKKARVGEISNTVAAEIADAMLGVPKTVHASEALLPAALEIALDSGRTVYDSLYLALAAFLGCEAVTADERLYRGLANTRWSALLRWVEDV